MTDYLWLITTAVDQEESAQELARNAVKAGLAACAQVDAAIQSHYIWESSLQESREWRVHFKTTEERKAALNEWILAHHPYEVPEILALKAESGNPGYTDWAGKS